MKTLYLYSNRDTILKRWQDGIAGQYDLRPFGRLDLLYRDLERDKPELVLFDYDGEIEAIEELLLYLSGSKNTQVMAFNSKPVYSDGVHLIKSGARALLNAYASPNNINQAIQAVLGGNIWLYPEFIQMMIKQTTIAVSHRDERLTALSSRERELAEMVALGMSNKEIAQMADITEQTVKTHLKTVYDKLGVGSRLELAIMVNHQSGV